MNRNSTLDLIDTVAYMKTKLDRLNSGNAAHTKGALLYSLSVIEKTLKNSLSRSKKTDTPDIPPIGIGGHILYQGKTYIVGGRFLKMLPEWLECANDKDGPWIKCEEVKS